MNRQIKVSLFNTNPNPINEEICFKGVKMLKLLVVSFYLLLLVLNTAQCPHPHITGSTVTKICFISISMKIFAVCHFLFNGEINSQET